MRVITHVLNIVLWLLLGIAVFQAYTGITVPFINDFINVRLVTDLLALVVLALDVLCYTGVLGGKKGNMNLITISVVLLVWMAVIVLLVYAFHKGRFMPLFAAWDVIAFGFAMPYLVYRGYKK